MAERKPILIPAVLSAALIFGSASCQEADPQRAAFALVDKYYPDLSAAGLKAQQIIELEGLLIPTRIINYTELKIDKNTLGTFYQFYESIPKTKPVLSHPKFRYDLSIQVRSVKNRVMVIVPKGIPRPKNDRPFISLGEDLVSKAGGATAQYPDTAFTYIYPSDLADFDSIQGVTLGVAVESCQQTLRVRPLDGSGNPIRDEQLELIAQEFYCNSSGYAVAASSMGLSYPAYRQIYKDTRPFFMVDEKSYSFMPKAGPVVK